MFNLSNRGLMGLALASGLLSACSGDRSPEPPAAEAYSQVRSLLTASGSLPAALGTTYVASQAPPPSPTFPAPPTIVMHASVASASAVAAAMFAPATVTVPTIAGAQACGGPEAPVAPGQLGCRSGDCYRNPSGDGICAEPPGFAASSRVLYYCPKGTTVGPALSDCRPTGGLSGNIDPVPGYGVCCTPGK
jgi:hypothetical protein